MKNNSRKTVFESIFSSKTRAKVISETRLLMESRSVGSRIGQIISSSVAQNRFNPKWKNIFDADFQQYVGDYRTIVNLFLKSGNVGRKDVDKFAEQMRKVIGVGKIWCVHCKHNTLTKEDICNFFNSVVDSEEVPFKLEPDMMKELPTAVQSVGAKVEDKHDWWGVNIEEYEPTTAADRKEAEDDIKASDNLKAEISGENDTQENIESMKEAFQDDMKEMEYLNDKDINLRIGTKKELESLFRRDKSGWSRLEDNQLYALVFGVKDQIDEPLVATLVSSAAKGFFKCESTGDSVIYTGILRKKNPLTNKFEDYATYAMELTEIR